MKTSIKVLIFRGLNLDVVLRNLFKVYCDPGNLVLVLNSSDEERKYLTEKLNQENIHNITYDNDISER